MKNAFESKETKRRRKEGRGSRRMEGGKEGRKIKIAIVEPLVAFSRDGRFDLLTPQMT